MDSHRLTIRLQESDFEKLSLMAKKKGYSINEFIVVMLERYIDIENGSYELGTLEVQRLNQIIEACNVMAINMASLESTVTNGFDSFLQLTRGDNYLLEDEDADFL